MSTIQTQVSLVQNESGVGLGSAVIRTAQESGITISSVALTTSADTLLFGDVVYPREIVLKLVSGDAVLVSVDNGSTFPLILSGAGAPMLIGLDSRTVSEITCVADVDGSLGGKYFIIYDLNGPVWVWLDTGNGDGAAASGSITYNTPEVAVAATGIIDPTGVDNSVLYTADTAGFAGNSITIEYIISGGGSAVTGISVIGSAIAITAGSATTAATVITAVNADAPAAALVTASPSGADTGVIGTVAATNLTGGLESSSVVVNGTTCTYVASLPGANQFSTIGELEILVEAIANLDSEEDGIDVSITASAVGTAGNAYTLALGANTAGDMVISGATLTGGINSSIEPTFTTERLLPVVIVSNDSADTVADKVAAALDADVSFFCSNPAAATLTITDTQTGPRTTIAVGTSTFTSPSAVFAAPAVVQWKSLGTSQVAVAIAPV